ncbi:MAG: DUF3276 family protein, partial [Bacteroidetes bacterium]|nr:DUF3276 family protein [Bacteroidota bacterium]
VFSKSVRAGARKTYFFDIRTNKSDDYLLIITESKRRFNAEGFDRFQINIYKEDINKFMAALEETVNHFKTELLPDYDFDEFSNRFDEDASEKEQETSSSDAYSGSSSDVPSVDDSETW